MKLQAGHKIPQIISLFLDIMLILCLGLALNSWDSNDSNVKDNEDLYLF